MRFPWRFQGQLFLAPGGVIIPQKEATSGTFVTGVPRSVAWQELAGQRRRGQFCRQICMTRSEVGARGGASVRPGFSAADRVRSIVSARDSGLYGALTGASDQAALDR